MAYTMGELKEAIEYVRLDEIKEIITSNPGFLKQDVHEGRKQFGEKCPFSYFIESFFRYGNTVDASDKCLEIVKLMAQKDVYAGSPYSLEGNLFFFVGLKNHGHQENISLISEVTKVLLIAGANPGVKTLAGIFSYQFAKELELKDLEILYKAVQGFYLDVCEGPQEQPAGVQSLKKLAAISLAKDVVDIEPGQATQDVIELINKEKLSPLERMLSSLELMKEYAKKWDGALEELNQLNGEGDFNSLMHTVKAGFDIYQKEMSQAKAEPALQKAIGGK